MTLLFSDIISQSIRAQDGEIGKVKDVLFDDRTWRVRYLVIDTAKWLPGKKVIIAPQTFRSSPRSDDYSLTTTLTKQEIKGSPELRTDLPVYRQYEEAIHTYYGWTPYWSIPMTVAGWPYPDVSIFSPERSRYYYPQPWQRLVFNRREHFDAHLRSAKEIMGYKIGTIDREEFGEVENFILNSDEWYVFDLVLGSNRWLPGGQHVTCSPLLVNSISVSKKLLEVSLDKNTLINGPQFSEETYGRPYREQVVAHYAKQYLPSDISRDNYAEQYEGRRA